MSSFYLIFYAALMCDHMNFFLSSKITISSNLLKYVMRFSSYAQVTLLNFAVLTLDIFLHYTNMYVEIVRLKSKLTHYKYQYHFLLLKSLTVSLIVTS